jgi:hypothetical protein
MLAPQSSAMVVVKNCFIEIFEKWIFQGVIACGVQDLRERQVKSGGCRAFL